MTRKQRREELRDNWFFICECTHCQAHPLEDYENCIECENPLCDQLISVPEKPDSQFAHTPSKPIECPSCRCLVDEDTIADYQSAVAFTRQRLKSLKEESPALETCLAILEKQGNILPPLNVWRVRALDFAFNSVSHLGIWNKSLEYGKSNMAGMKLHYGEEHPSLGLFYMKMSRASMYLKMYREGLKYGQLSESILKVAFGPNHLLITEVIHRLMTIANEDLEILLERRIEKQKQNEHEKVCKHCGKRKGIKPKIDDEDKEKKQLIVVPKPTSNGIVKDIGPVEKPKENLIVTFKPNGTTKELLSDRVLEYLNSLEIY